MRGLFDDDDEEEPTVLGALNRILDNWNDGVKNNGQ